MFGLGKRIKAWVNAQKYKIMTVSTVLALVGQTENSTIDYSQITDMIYAFLPLIITFIAILIPLKFLGAIMKLFERLFEGFK